MGIELKERVQAVWNDRALLKETEYIDVIRDVIESVDKGRLRIALTTEEGWEVNEWVKQAI